jgi:hypothetical protein
MAQVDEIYHFHWDKNPAFSVVEILGILLIAAGALVPQQDKIMLTV